jgi:hypothetical protein
METVLLCVIFWGVIIMAGDWGGRLYKYPLLDKLYNLTYNNNAVTPYKSTTYSVLKALSKSCSASPLQYMEIWGGGGGGKTPVRKRKPRKHAQAN